MAKRLKFAGRNAVKVSPDQYSKLLKVYLLEPTISATELAKKAGVTQYNAKRALTTGWPIMHFPRLAEASAQWIDPLFIHAEMARMDGEHQQIAANLFGALATRVVPETPERASRLRALATEDDPNIAGREASKRMGESAFAARISMSLAAKTARTAEFLAREYLKMIEDGQVELPEKIRPEHLFLLAKIADTASNAVHKALQTERLRAGQPETIAGAHISALLVGATAEELKQVVTTGLLPARMMGLVDQPALSPIDVEPILTNSQKLGLTEEQRQGQEDESAGEEEDKS